MKVIATNVSKPVTIHWKGRDQITGIFKRFLQEGIFLNPKGVLGDTIGNPKVHGGSEKACYLFSQDHYPFWQQKYPDLDWEYGMFGENLTLEGLQEDVLLMGSTYQIGEAVVRITTPREPCYKLGLRFGNQGIIEEFIQHGHPGAYVSVLKAGRVLPGDQALLLESPAVEVSIADYFKLLYSKSKDAALIENIMSLTWLSQQKKNQFLRWQA